MLIQRFYIFNSKHFYLLCTNNKLATSFNWKRSSVIGSVKTEISFFKTSLFVPFKVIDNINYDAILGHDFIEKNVESINVKQRKLTLACGTEIFFRERDFSYIDNVSPRDSDSLVIGELRVETRRPSFARR